MRSILATSLDHANLSSASLETDLIHQFIDQEDTSPSLGKNILAHDRTGNRIRVKTLPGVPYHDKDSTLFVAADANVHKLVRIVTTAIEYGVGQGLSQSQGDLELVVLCAALLDYKGHNLVDYWLNGFDGTRYPTP